MFGLFSNKDNCECPIDGRFRLWMENAFLWLIHQFGHENIISKPILLPTPEDFPVEYNGSKESMIKTAEIIAKQMEIDINSVVLENYQQNIQEFGGDMGYKIFTQVDKESDEKLSAGLYFDKNEEGKYEILIETKNLNEPENLVATIAHEFSHIKILGEKRLDFNDEALTDLNTVVFGLGIFNANSAFKEHKTFYSYGHRSIGYLKQREWGYALALYSYYRKEQNPEWIQFLTSNIKSDFKKSRNFINANTDKVFNERYERGS